MLTTLQTRSVHWSPDSGEMDMHLAAAHPPGLAASDAEFLVRARQLRGLINGNMEPGSCSRILSEGFRDLSTLAMDSRNHRIAATFRSLSSIFARVDKSVPEDLPFVMNTVAQFLDTLLLTDSRGSKAT